MNKTVSVIVSALVIVFALGLLLSYPAMLLWNYCLVPAVTVLTEVTWLQMWGIVVLCNLLFKTAVNTK